MNRCDLDPQRGMTLTSWLLVLAIIGFAITLGFRMGTAYWEYYNAVNIAQAVQQNPDLAESDREEVVRTLDRYMRDKNIDHLGTDIYVLQREDERLVVHVLYEARRPIVGNVDVVIAFDRRIGP